MSTDLRNTLLYGALGAFIGLLFGVSVYIGTAQLWNIAVCVAGGLILGGVAGFVSEEDG